ncbi:MAG: CHRD domain-containing protein, partial [Tepidisphaeraceae bacterium]
GFNETDGVGTFGLGDPDGAASGTFTFNTSTDTVSWNITYSNLATLNGFHIHTGNFNQNGGIVVPMPLTPGSGTLSGSMVDTDVDSIAANPNGFYANIHDSNFGSGAVRGQIPEPASLALLALPAVMALRRRRA